MKASAILSAILVVFSVLSGHAQESTAPLQIRAVYHNPVKPVVELYLPDRAGAMVKLDLVAEGLSGPQHTQTIDGWLVFHSQPEMNPEKPLEGLAARYRLPPDLKRAIVLIFPAPDSAKLPYRVEVMDDSPAVFQNGQSRAINLTGNELVVLAGEHRLTLLPGKVTTIPAVKKVNEFNMAQTNFYYKEVDNWIPFTERRLQFLDTTRRIFLVYFTPGSTQPFVTTIVDNAVEQVIQ